ncbi:Putative ferric reductase, NAD binding domain, ferric reductase transmembrane component-like protein [Septoria linicola]|uniref:ferric-chelate reductase (NADPH) n=1 Tax=Septoria linicola TaxID=215465 RepID=A0A9Q9AK14_9PEZI|nr:putative ferric reductase, NAD binding domain, ferric reductase transmembrane component-like protein [Septoria linicola]USW47361.1 Putative ferric reductase, NAD binding domain, ferric reductase transmembrane component-like protein [Septoria linicola]
MPSISELFARRAGVALNLLQPAATHPELAGLENTAYIEKRVSIPCCNSTSPAGLVEAHTLDPWEESGKYALGWVYFSVIVLVATTLLRWYHFWNDKIRVAAHKESVEELAKTASPATDYELSGLATDRSTRKFFPQEQPLPKLPLPSVDHSLPWIVRKTLAAFRYLFYRPIPNVRIHKRMRPIIFPSISVCLLVLAATAFTLLYSFLPRPLFWASIQFGSPPLAIRSGMIAVALMPWIIGLSMKANFISLLTGIGHERLNVLHRWLAYIFLALSIIHTVPFYITPVWDGGMQEFQRLLRAQQSGVYIYGTGIAALVPTVFLAVHSLGPLRRKFYEVFVVVHVPVSVVLLGMLFWHCHNYLTSWHYLWATTSIWAASYALRVIVYLNWTNPFRVSWGIGEEAAVTVLEENAVKVTIPTQVRWKPGQYIYLRMPGISFFENHPFTIASMCSDDYPSGYGDKYRDMVVLFRPFGGFTKKVLNSALDHGPWWTYRAFIDGPYGGMRRSMDSFDHIVLIAGGTGITAIVSHLLDLIKRMRDGKAVTKDIHLIWAMKRPETMEWFKEELRICREFAPPDTVSCQFYITAAKRQTHTGKLVSAQTPGRPVSMVLHDKVNDVFQSIASNRFSMSSNRHSALIEAEANGNADREKELRDENTDRLQPLPQAHLKPMRSPSQRHLLPSVAAEAPALQETPHMPPHPTLHEKRRSKQLSLDISSAQVAQASQIQQVIESKDQGFDFGFPSTPTEFQKNLMRFAFMPRVAVKSKRSGWSVEWGRPEIPYMLKELSEEWTGKRACVFVCGPPTMRTDVSAVVAGLQTKVLGSKTLDEIYLHTENYAL